MVAASDQKSKEVTEAEETRFFSYQVWDAAGQMAFQLDNIERMGNDPHYKQKLDAAKAALMSSWLALEQTGLIKKLFAEEAAKNLQNISSSKYQMEEMSHA